MSTYVWLSVAGTGMFLTWLLTLQIVRHPPPPPLPEPVPVPLKYEFDLRVASVNEGTVGLEMVGSDARVWPSPRHMSTGDSVRVSVTANEKGVLRQPSWVKGTFVPDERS